MALPAASHSRDLTDEQWVLIGPFLPKLARRTDGRGRPWRENRAVLNGILWILRTGAPWADLPDRSPSYQTCHRRFQQWVRAGVLRGVLDVLAQALHDEGYEMLKAGGAKPVTLRTSFRSRPNIQRAINASFEPVMTGDHNLVAGKLRSARTIPDRLAGTAIGGGASGP
jgi:transposase